MNGKVYEFEAEIKKVPGMDGAYMDFLTHICSGVAGATGVAAFSKKQ
jgi:hypothetical protein